MKIKHIKIMQLVFAMINVNPRNKTSVSFLRFLLILFLGLFQFMYSNAQIPEDLIIWKFKSGAFNNAPIIKDSVVYCGSMDGIFYAVDLNSGQEIWHYSTSSPITSNATIQGEIVCFESGNKLYGLDKDSGNFLWEFVDRVDAPTEGYPTGYHHSSPVIHKDVAYYGDEWGNLNGVNIHSGKLNFQFKIYKRYRRPEDKFIRSTPIIKNDIIYFGDYGARVYAISLIDSSEIWSHAINSPLWDGSVVSEMTIKDSIIYFGGYNNTFSPLNLHTGKEIWSFTDSKTFLPSTPVFYEDQVIIGSTIQSNKIYSLNIRTGKEKWSTKTKGIFFVKPTCLRDSILIGNSTEPFGDKMGMLYFINLEDGSIIDEIPLPEATESSPVIINDRILLGRHDGLYLFEPPILNKKE